jgi:hypothetical protein
MIRQKGNQNPRYFRRLLEALCDGRLVATSRPRGPRAVQITATGTLIPRCAHFK